MGSGRADCISASASPPCSKARPGDDNAPRATSPSAAASSRVRSIANVRRRPLHRGRRHASSRLTSTADAVWPLSSSESSPRMAWRSRGAAGARPSSDNAAMGLVGGIPQPDHPRNSRYVDPGGRQHLPPTRCGCVQPSRRPQAWASSIRPRCPRPAPGLVFHWR